MFPCRVNLAALSLDVSKCECGGGLSHRYLGSLVELDGSLIAIYRLIEGTVASLHFRQRGATVAGMLLVAALAEERLSLYQCLSGLLQVTS